MAQAQTGIAGNKPPAPAVTQTGIAGNNSGQIGQATAARAKAHDKSVYFHAAVALVLVVLGVTLAGHNLSFFWKLVVGFVFIIVGGKLATVKGYDKYRGAWPQVFRGLGWGVVLTTLLLSGIGQWTGSVAEGVDTAAFCAVEANNNDDRCKVRRAKEQEDKAKAEAERSALMQQYAPPAAVPEKPRLPDDIRVLCEDPDRNCGHVPRSEEVQRAIAGRSGSTCVGYHFEPARNITPEVDEEEITFVIPPNTDFWWFHLKKGEQFRDRPRC